MTISDYLAKEHKQLFGIDSIVVPNGIDYNLIYNKNAIKNKKNTILMNIRQESLKAGYILIDIIKKLTLKAKDIKIIVLDNTKENIYCVNNNDSVEIEYIKGPVDRNTIYEKLNESTILVDSSISEGFGLLPLEAMAGGVVPVVSNALGNNEYCTKDNSVVIDKVNDADVYVEEILGLLNDKNKLEKLSQNAMNTSKKYMFDEKIFNFYEELNNIKDGKVKKIKYNLTDNDNKLIEEFLLSDEDYKKILKWSKKTFSKPEIYSGKHNRLHNFKVLVKEFGKSSIYLAKLGAKSIKDKNFRI